MVSVTLQVDSKEEGYPETDPSNPHKLQNLYDDWSTKYDKDLCQTHGYRVPQVAASHLAKFIEPDDHIIDMGAGTGLVGVALHHLGYKNLSALDFSTKMLDEAKSKTLYHQIVTFRLGEGLPALWQADALIAVGLLGPTHLQAEAIPELLSWVRPGGTLVFTLRSNEYEPNNAFGQVFTRLEQEGHWQPLGQVENFPGLPKKDPNFLFHAWAFRRAL